jgi:hypothetical protein
VASPELIRADGRPGAARLGDGLALRSVTRGADPPSSRGTEPDEVILTGQIHDHAARLRSFEIAAKP